MDKTFAFTMIVFFVICACFLTWAALEEPKRNRVCNFLAYGYVTLVWVFIIGLTILTITL